MSNKDKKSFILSLIKLEVNEMTTFGNSKIKTTINNNIYNQKLNSNEIIKEI